MSFKTPNKAIKILRSFLDPHFSQKGLKIEKTFSSKDTPGETLVVEAKFLRGFEYGRVNSPAKTGVGAQITLRKQLTKAITGNRWIVLYPPVIPL